MNNYKRRFGDRKEGRLLRSLPAFAKFIPFIMPTRNDACNQYEESFEVTDLDRRLRQLRVAGYKGIGFLHFIIAAYIRGVSMLPGINRFVVGRRIYARDNIEVVMTVKRSLSVDATETTIKVVFEPTDTIFDVYRKMNEKIDEVKTSDGNNNTEDVAETLCRAPRFLLRFALTILRIMDYFGWLPEKLVEASPFHGCDLRGSFFKKFDKESRIAGMTLDNCKLDSTVNLDDFSGLTVLTLISSGENLDWTILGELPLLGKVSTDEAMYAAVSRALEGTGVDVELIEE